MAKRNEQACELYFVFKTKFNYPALVTREKATEILGTSKHSINTHIAKGNLKLDKVSNKIFLMSIAEFMCSK